MSGNKAQASPGARSASRKSARKLVKSIAKKHGHLGEEILSQMSPEVRREVEEALVRKDEIIGSSVITLAKNLYTSSARFVYELLQNADDNFYTIAKSASATPFVSFRVYPRRIVLEYNEDGFTHENLIAICNVGQSSKTNAQGYIGEKGIGFKSVFMVASKVLIQSGHFSFYFQHRKHDSGMGMISPTGSPENLAKERATTLQQFQELQATFLLFMKNIRRIKVEIYDHDDQKPVSSTCFSMEQQDHDRVELRKQTVMNGEVYDYSQQYYITKDTITDLPQNENRRYTDAEMAEATYAEAEVILAFPLTQDSVPIIEPQDVFAFLPVRKMGFPFLMQSDFVTDASREDIVRTSARNASLLAAAARVFVLAVSHLCKHPTLRYQWMRYLPDDKQHSWDPFWTRFLEAIHSNLKITPTLWTKSHKKLRYIEDMRRVPSTMKDKYGEPLFADLDFEQYLAVEYLEKDLDLLTDHGLCMMRKTEFLARVRHDLNQEDEDSNMFDPDADADWHSQVAKALIDCWSQHSTQLKDLALIPLSNGEWPSAETIEDSSIFFSKVNGYSIPPSLYLRTVDKEAEKNLARRKLFTLLGVEETAAAHIRSIIAKYHSTHMPWLKSSKATVKFLYLTAHLDQENDNADFYKTIKLLDQLKTVRVAQSSTIYFPTDDPYGAQQLFRPSVAANDTSNLMLDISILHPTYLHNCPVAPEEEDLTWEDWLREKLNVRNVICLAKDGDQTKECLHIAKQHPERFVGFLLKYWKFNKGYLVGNKVVVNKLLNIQVPCENGDMYPLSETYLRSERLEYVNQFLRGHEFFPWLKQDVSSSGISGFSDLDVVAKELGFGYPKSDLEFYLTTLSFIARANKDAGKLCNVDRVYDLYSRIEARLHESLTVDDSCKMIQNAFESQRLIYTPAGCGWDAGWASPSDCLWEAPVFMYGYRPLKPFNEELDNIDEIREVYRKLNELCPDLESDVAKKIRDQIEEHKYSFHEAEDRNGDPK
ncbi:hypothetical protein BDV19DRAFT_393603 [Aspergillus venezuelensis]